MKKVLLSTLAASVVFQTSIAAAELFYSYPSIERPEQIVSLYLKNPVEIIERKEQAIKEFDEELSIFLATSIQQTSSEILLKKWDLLNAKLGSCANFFNAMTLVEPSDEVRKAYIEAYQEVKNKMIETFSDKREIYLFFDKLQEKEKKKGSLKEDEVYSLAQLIKEMKQEGMHLEGEKRKALTSVKLELSKISQDFAKNIQEDQSAIYVPKEDLEGLSSAFIEELEQKEGLYRLGCDYPTYFYVMKAAKKESVRKNLYRAFMNRAYPKNADVLASMIAKRDEMAKLLGFNSYSEYQLSNEMVKTTRRATEFLDELAVKSGQKLKLELKELVESSPELKLSTQGKLFPWDVAYAQDRLMKTKYDIDEEKIKEYFPLEHTLESLIQIYETFFDLKMRTVALDGLWHKDVKLMEISLADNKKPIGYILLDLFPRENKYSHACHATIISGMDDGKLNTTSLSLVVANFPKATKDKPALMSLSDARTFFHEFGHAIHAVLGRTRLVMNSGTSVKVDFVELPSQMLEEWLWDPSILKMVSCHYKTKEKLPDSIIDSLLKTRFATSGGFIGRQCLLSQFSLSCFMPGAIKDVDALMKNLHSKTQLYYGFDEHSHFQASFGHLDEYGARYYGYLWSRVFALDVFESIKKEGLLNPKIGKKYAKEILSKGGSKDPTALLTQFLGKEPSENPFLKAYGIIP